MKLLRVSLLAAALALLAACASVTPEPAAPASPAPTAALNVTGNWAITTVSQIGPQDSKLTLTQTGREIGGTMQSPQGAFDVTGTLEGQDLKFGFNYSGQGVELRIDFIGATDGQSMQGRAVFGSYGEGTFTAKRQ
jgi:hypothetical protein